MNWPTWRQAFLATAIAVLLAAVTRRRTDRLSTHLGPAAREFAGVAFLYGLWRIARDLPLTRDAGAIERARDIWEMERWLHLPSELSLQRFVLRHETLAEFMNAYYAIVHVPALIAFLVWLWVRHRDAYPHWRNGLVATTAGCLLVRYVRVAPPRFLPDLGFVDLSLRYGMSVYGPVGTGVSDQMAAMPSIHCGWAAVVGFGVWRLAPRPIRWIGPVHVVLTFIVVAATGNHWWLDGIVAVTMLGAALWIDHRWRSRPDIRGEPGLAGTVTTTAVGERWPNRSGTAEVGAPVVAENEVVGPRPSAGGVTVGASGSDGPVGGGEHRLQ